MLLWAVYIYIINITYILFSSYFYIFIQLLSTTLTMLYPPYCYQLLLYCFYQTTNLLYLLTYLLCNKLSKSNCLLNLRPNWHKLCFSSCRLCDFRPHLDLNPEFQHHMHAHTHNPSNPFSYRCCYTQSDVNKKSRKNDHTQP